MKKYEIMTDNFELRLGRTDDARELTAADVFTEYQDEDANAPVLVESYDNIDEARAAFRAHYANYGSTRAVRGVAGWLLLGQVAFLIENEYDEDGDYDQGGDIWEYSAEPYSKAGIDVKYFDQAVELMDDELREAIHADLAPCTDEEFLREYERRHLEKYGEPFTI